jgi:hypothetical protein
MSSFNRRRSEWVGIRTITLIMRASELVHSTHCVPTFQYPLFVPVHQMFIPRMDSSGGPYEISNLRISVLLSPRFRCLEDSRGIGTKLWRHSSAGLLPRRSIKAPTRWVSTLPKLPPIIRHAWERLASRGATLTNIVS